MGVMPTIEMRSAKLRWLAAALACLAMLCATAASSASAAQASSSCSTSRITRSDCVPAIAYSSDNEAEEPEEEMEEGGEEAATAEVEAEEAENGEGISPRRSSDAAGSATVSQLRLTARATTALARRLPAASAVAFSFTLSATAEVRVAIVKQTSTSGHARWTALPDTLTLALKQGSVARALKGHNHLSPGRYRLTVKPSGGRPSSIYLSVKA
jgi:hypothetical protein